MSADSLDLRAIRRAVQRDRYRYTAHARRQQRLRGVSSDELEHVLRFGRILEQRPTAKPYPECLMMAFVRQHEPLYVEVAYNAKADYIYIITVHWMDPAKWIDPWTRRKP